MAAASHGWRRIKRRDVWADPVAPTQILLFAEDSDPVYPHNYGIIPATPENLLAAKAALAGR